MAIPAVTDATVYIKELLDQYDLGSEVEWAWEQITGGFSAEYVVQQLRQRDAYKVRFAGLELRKQKGYDPMTENEYIAYERNARQIMRSAGMPVGFWDQNDDFTTLIGEDVSVAELSQRVNNGWQRVNDAPPEVRQYYNEMFGTYGDAALAATFLDPDRALPILEQQVNAGVVGGVGRIFGFDLSQSTAQRIGTFGLQDSQIYAGYERLAQLRPLLTETVSEQADLTADTGASAVFGIDGMSMEQFQRRQQERQAAMGGGGTAITSQKGLSLGPSGPQ